MKNLKMVKVKLVPDYKLHSDTIIHTSDDAAKLIMNELEESDREIFCVLNLNSKSNPISASITSVGELTSALVHPREVFKAAILSNAAGVILFHCHPSGDPTPSKEDISTTKRLLDCGKILGINVVDHIIVGRAKYVSLKNLGYMENNLDSHIKGTAAELFRENMPSVRRKIKVRER